MPVHFRAVAAGALFALVLAGSARAAPYAFDSRHAEVRFAYSLAFSSGQGVFTDPRIGVDVRRTPDLVTPKLPALKAYQLSLAKPSPPAGSFDAAASQRGVAVFAGPGRCSSCHGGIAITDERLHTPSEVGTEGLYASRSATRMYRSTPLRGLWQHAPYFHDGSAKTLPDVVEHYERVVAREAIDAGAHVVIGHHAHILRGIEFHRGRPVFHGLGNFVSVTRALSPAGDSPERRAWAERRQKLFGFVPDPTMPAYPFHPDSRHTMVARCVVHRDGRVEAGFVPGWVDQQARPVPLSRDAAGERCLAYVEDINARAGLKARFAWDDQGFVAVTPPDAAR